jgi:hypothetical protein
MVKHVPVMDFCENALKMSSANPKARTNDPSVYWNRKATISGPPQRPHSALH